MRVLSIILDTPVYTEFFLLLSRRGNVSMGTIFFWCTGTERGHYRHPMYSVYTTYRMIGAEWEARDMARKIPYNDRMKNCTASAVERTLARGGENRLCGRLWIGSCRWTYQYAPQSREFLPIILWFLRDVKDERARKERRGNKAGEKTLV